MTSPRHLRLLSAFGLLIALLAPTTAAFAFDGKITVKTTYHTSTQQGFVYNLSVYSVQGDFFRGDHQLMSTKENKVVNSGAVIHNPQKGERYTLRKLPIARKDASWVYDLDPLDPATSATETNRPTPPEIKATGRSAKIAGHRADEYVFEDAIARYELWATKDLGRFPLEKDAIFGKEPWLSFVLEKNLFALRVVTVKKHNSTSTRIEVTKVEPGAQPAELFLLPPDAVRAEPKEKKKK